ncbi:exosome complex component RRP45 [Petromyzon marinus]|uniref:Exosome complex component RRP45 n=1 Tax=Petromyzon marinus TaxID=7757 RepID=A0AAJ7T525_PETMA|nr:exosome complex component RRP45 [Petromyzon marinus]
MKEVPLSNCERAFILQAIKERKRLDGRETYDYRRMKLMFGVDSGCCMVELGKTRVLAQVSCELVAPKQNRPTDGILFVNLELSPMASPALEAGRQSEMGVELNRLLERCLRTSRCVDTESLCVIAGEKVWQIRADVHLLNHDGNVLDAATVAAVTALAHFRRPDVSVQGSEVTVYPPEERDPVPLSIHHMPMPVSFAFFEQGTYLLVDATELEERVMDGRLVIAMNKHGELCAVQSSGGIMLTQDQMLRCTKIANVKVGEITELIQRALKNDAQARKEGRKCGMAESLPTQRITALRAEEAVVSAEEAEEAEDRAREVVAQAEPAASVVSELKVWGHGTAQIGEGLHNAWAEDEEELESEDDKVDDEMPGEEGLADTGTELRDPASVQADKSLGSDDSEEDEVVILNPATTKTQGRAAQNAGARPKTGTAKMPAADKKKTKNKRKKNK